MRSVGLAPCARVDRVAIMFEFLKQPISLKRAPSKVPSAPDEAPDLAPAEEPGTVAAASRVPTEAPSSRARAPRPQPFKFLKQPISLKRAPSKAGTASNGAPVAAPAEGSGTVASASSVPADAPRQRGRAPRPQAFKFLRQPISLKRAPSKAVDASNGAPVAAPAEGSGTAAEASSTLTEAPRQRRRAHRPQRSRSLVGLEIEPGQLIAVQSRLNGHVVVERAAGTPIAANLVRDGEVTDVDALSSALSELFDGSGLDRRVRIGIANQRIVMRQIELPPITDPKELDSAVHFQAQNEIPMPIESVVLDYHPLGIEDTPAGPRMQVLLVAARRDMVERMLLAARQAGLRPEGVDLAAFGMIRALRPSDSAVGEQILYLSIGGLTNLAIANGATCQFTRVITTGVEQIVAEVAATAGVPLSDARRLIAGVGASAAESAEPASHAAPAADDTVAAATADHDQVARLALADGIRRIAAEVRNSLDFHLSSHGNVPVSRAVLTGPALDVPGFDLALGRELGLPLIRGEVALASPGAAGHVPMSRLAVAAGLSLAEGAK
jgi:type IV pilus assembly protein PilM